MGLKGLPAVLSPDLLAALAAMGHGDEIVLADAGFPTSSVARANGEAAFSIGLIRDYALSRAPFARL